MGFNEGYDHQNTSLLIYLKTGSTLAAFILRQLRSIGGKK